MTRTQPDDGERRAIAEQPEISDDDLVVRKIPQRDLKDIGGGERRVSKAAFSASSKRVDPEQGMSVDLYSALQQAGINPDSHAYAPEFEVLMTLKVGDLRDKFGLAVVRRPQRNNPAHCHVLGVRPNMRKGLLQSAGWLRRPPDVFRSVDEAR